MEAKGLMVGNYLKKDGITVKIDARSIFDMFNENPKYEPIPLTEEWLLKSGFNNLNYGYELAIELDRLLQLVVSNGDYYPQLIQLPEMSGLDSQVVSLNSINYIHELQNLWYVLTGKELTI